MSRDRIHIAVGLSLLAHGLLMAIPVVQKPGGMMAGIDTPLTVTIVEAPSSAPEPAPVPEPTPESPPPPARPVKSPAPRVARAEAIPVNPPQPAVPEAPREPKVDMLAMIDARRERRRAQEAAARQFLESQDRGNVEPQGADAALANINRNLLSLRPDGDSTGGVFQILNKGTRTAEFAFNGWKPDSQRRWREVIEVDAGPGGDVELAIVRRMIELIRTHYSGDFIWNSHRMGRSIVLSARQADNEELETFLVREFFGTPVLGHGH